MIDFRSTCGTRASALDNIQVRIASPEEIRGPKDPKERERLEIAGLRTWWSWGEVTSPETVNYRSFRPEKDGIFCERIFGPVKDWECHCGKYKRIRYSGVICDRCGVEVTLSKVRRDRMGHIELAVSVAHIWFFKQQGNPMGRLLGMTMMDLEKVIYYSNYVVIEPGNQDVRTNQLLDEDEYLTLRWKAREEDDTSFLADIGASAVREQLRRIDLETLEASLAGALMTEHRVTYRRALEKRLGAVRAFLAGAQAGARPEWMILEAVPMIPPDLRPLVPLDGNRFATSDVNLLYRRVINRNNRLKKLILHRAPEVILRNEKRMLQEAVDALFDNGRRSKAIRGRGKRPLKSLSDMLKGKQGRFRQNLLGKRVDYSGRSVIVVGPELRLHQCGLPKAMALELFKPFIIHKLVDKGIAETVKRAKKIVERESPEVYEILEEIIRDHPVLLNRAPTLHRLGIQAFEPVLVEGKAIRIHPLVCAAFNADFDGDQMAVHVPLSFEAQIEARVLMLSSNNILKPSDGRPVAEPSQDIVLGCYFATKGTRGLAHFATDPVRARRLRVYGSAAEVEQALGSGALGLHWPIRFVADDRDACAWIITTAGRVLFNAIVPADIEYQNREMTKQALSELVYESYRRCGLAETVAFLERLKAFGFHHATRAGVSIGMEDLLIPTGKAALLQEAADRVARVRRRYVDGWCSVAERRQETLETWAHATSDVADAMVKALAESQRGFNPVFMMLDSGSRGSRDQLRQLAGMRGLVTRLRQSSDGQASLVETPITANLREGLSPLAYFLSCHGARKTLADTALKTADAGYLTRRLVDVAQDVTITEEDCGTIFGVEVTARRYANGSVEPLAERIVGNVAAEDVEDPHVRGENGRLRVRVLVEAGQLVDEETAREIEEAGIETVTIRSVLTCEAKRGLCRTCYGRNLATMQLVDLGEAIGIIAAQSIGEPGTQLTLRTSQSGGLLPTSAGRQLTAHRSARTIASDVAGLVRYVDLVEGTSLHDERDATTALRTRTVGADREKQLDPRIEIWEQGQWRDRLIRSHLLPDGAELLVDDGSMVEPGQALAQLPVEVREAYDMTGGLPRIAELFEARVPRRSAVLADTDGIIRLGRVARGKREIFVTPGSMVEGDLVADPEAYPAIYEIPVQALLLVATGDRVRAGDRLSEGPVNPHDILRIKGPRAVQEYLLNEVQEVYRLQGVKINDKHIGVIVKQMLQKVRVMDPGETEFLEGEHADKGVFRESNERAKKRKERPAAAEPLLLGITKASLTTQSFISAASFQETTRVLTDAAIRGAKDELRGLKENIIIGHLIPAGTGMYRYNDVEIEGVGMPTPEELPAVVEEPEGAGFLGTPSLAEFGFAKDSDA